MNFLFDPLDKENKYQFRGKTGSLGGLQWQTLINILSDDQTYYISSRKCNKIGWDSFFYLSIGANSSPESCVHSLKIPSDRLWQSFSGNNHQF